MEEKKYQELYQRYKELKEKTSLKASTKDKKEVNIQSLDVDSIKEKEEIIELLKDSLDFLSDSELIELSCDNDFKYIDKVNGILNNRLC